MHIDPSMQMLAAGYIDKQLAKLMLHLKDARTAQDIEDIHQARVACRRIRAALRLFHDCFEQDDLATWQKQIKKLLRSFGAARDLDVQIEFLKDILNNLDTEHKKLRPGIRRMLLRWQQQRNKIQTRVVKTIDKTQKNHLLTNIHIQMEKILFELKPLNPPIDSPAVRKRAYDEIQLRIKDFLDKLESLQRPNDITGHHALRIGAKKLRYALEVCDTAVKGMFKPAIKKIKKIQTILGDMHDCDVWNADINQFIQKEKEETIDFYGHSHPFSRILPGVLYLQQERKEHRDQLYCRANEYLNQLNEEAFWISFPQVINPDTPSEGEHQTHVQSDNNTELAETDVQNHDSV